MAVCAGFTFATFSAVFGVCYLKHVNAQLNEKVLRYTARGGGGVRGKRGEAVGCAIHEMHFN